MTENNVINCQDWVAAQAKRKPKQVLPKVTQQKPTPSTPGSDSKLQDRAIRALNARQEKLESIIADLTGRIEILEMTLQSLLLKE